MPLNYTIITDRSGAVGLASRLQLLSSDMLVAVDTEFIRVKEYYPKLALLQLNLAGDIFIVDPLSAPLDTLLPSLLATKAQFLIFSGDEDLQILVQEARRYQPTAQAPLHYCDLQVLEAFSGKGYGRGLANMVKEWCGIELSKDETLSDWLQRPLSLEQLHYAALDVAFLPELYAKLRASVSDSNFALFVREMAERCPLLLTPPVAELAYRSFGGPGLLSVPALQLLQFICAKRLNLAQAQDEALNRIITGKALCEICHRRPQNPQQLAACGMKWGAIRDHGSQVLTWVAAGASLEITPLPLPFDAFAHLRELQDDFRRLRHRLEQVAKDAHIAPQLMGGRKAVYDFYLAFFEGRPSWLESTWRHSLIGPLPTLDFSTLKKPTALIAAALERRRQG